MSGSPRCATCASTQDEKYKFEATLKASDYFAMTCKEKDANKKIELYSKAIELNPKYAGAHANLAELYITTGKEQDAWKTIR